MTGTTSPSPLIDRYIYDVVRRLPKDQRKDIELELRALIDDMLGGAAEESEVAGVLQNLGKPADLARRYRESEPCVVGPENYETYRLVLKIVLICVGVGDRRLRGRGVAGQRDCRQPEGRHPPGFRNPRRRCPLACRRVWGSSP